VFAFRKQLLRAILLDREEDGGGIAGNKVVLVMAEAGAGKSTQIPAYVMDRTSERIAVTQPRRVAAVTLAQRVARELQQRSSPSSANATAANAVGRRVGYRVRFDDRTTHETQLAYVTDGMLLREAMVDPHLSRYGVVFLDEVHERSLQTDVLLGVAKRARSARMGGNDPLRVVIMSATLDAGTFVSYFGGPDCVRVMEIPGRQFPVQPLYASKPVDDYVEATLSTIVQIVVNHHCDGDDGGDILAFLPGQEEIEDVATLLRNHLLLLEEEQRGQEHLHAGSQFSGDRVEPMGQAGGREDRGGSSGNSHIIVNGVMICPLYAALPPEAQLAAFREKPPGCRRKVVLATNIAETR